jgi:hypothetical protein
MYMTLAKLRHNCDQIQEPGGDLFPFRVGKIVRRSNQGRIEHIAGLD